MATQDAIRRAKELLDLEKELAGIRAETLEDQRSNANALQDSVAALKFERTERNEIRSISKQISRIASEAYAISVDDLGDKAIINFSEPIDSSLLSIKGTNLSKLKASSLIGDNIDSTTKNSENLIIYWFWY